MKTSYFGRANSKAFKERGLRFVSVARSCRYWTGEKYPDLFPTWDMVSMAQREWDKGDNQKVIEKYEKMYREQILDKLDPLQVYEDLEDAVILCHESIDKIEAGIDFCHRHMIAKWLEEELWLLGIDVEIPELKDEKADLKKLLKGSKSKDVKGQMELDWD